MHKRLLAKLACPACRAETLELKSKEEAQGEIIEGTLICLVCKQHYPITNRVPRMLIGAESQTVKQAFSAQWKLRYAQAFESENRVFWLDNRTSVAYLSDTLLGDIPPQTWILDAGCGSGEKSQLLASQNPEAEIIALDFADSISDLADKTSDQPNLHIIQGDVSNLPLRELSVDHIVSIGVLHHTPQTWPAFKAVSQMLKPQGKLVVWIYPHFQESPAFQKGYYLIRDRLFQGKGHLMTPQKRLKILRRLCFPMFGLLPLFWLSRAISPQFYGQLSLQDIYRGLVFLLYDDLAPAYQHRHSRLEVINWYYECGFTHIQNPELGLFMGEKRQS